jgi:hypothetical protein
VYKIGEYKMKLNALLIVLTIVITSSFIVIGCSSSIAPIKPGGTNSDKTVVSVPPLQTERSTAGVKLTFPASNDIVDLNTYQNAAYYRLAETIRLYRRVTGAYPESMFSFVRSGFPMHWPRNIATGAPVGVLAGRAFNLDKSDLGLIKWEKFSDDHAKLTFVDLDSKAYRDSGIEKWNENYIEFNWREWETYRGETLDDTSRAFRAGLRPGDDVKEKSIDIIGGTVPVNDVLSKENRMIYGMCGQIHLQVCRAAENYYFSEKNFTLPPTFGDLYSGFKNKPGFQNEHSLIIRENFADFAQLLKASGADFKIGFDYSKNAQYTWLKPGDETLIAFCRLHDPNNAYGIGSQYLGIEYDKDGEIIDSDYAIYKSSADMSSPMITASNLDQIEIPDEITISIEDIPLGE